MTEKRVVQDQLLHEGIIGKKIVAVSYLSSNDLQDLGWLDEDANKVNYIPCIRLENGCIIIAGMDSSLIDQGSLAVLLNRSLGYGTVVLEPRVRAPGIHETVKVAQELLETVLSSWSDLIVEKTGKTTTEEKKKAEEPSGDTIVAEATVESDKVVDNGT